MSTDPWTSDDPQPEDFDAVLGALPPDSVEHHAGDPDARLRILVSVDGDDARRLQHLAETHDKTPHDVVADLLRDADQSAA